MPRYNVNSPVKHGGRIVKSGVLSLECEDAEPLLRSGALSPAEDGQEPKPAAKSTSKATKAKG